MEFKKKQSVSGSFAKKGQDIRNGDLITITSEGKEVDGQYGTQNVFNIKTSNGEFIMSFNQTSINSLVDEFGGESRNWVGKNVHVHAIKQNVSGKFLDVYYVAPIGYQMGENGFEKVSQEANSAQQSQQSQQSQQAQKEKELPTINIDDGQEIRLEDVPF